MGARLLEIPGLVWRGRDWCRSGVLRLIAVVGVPLRPVTRAHLPARRPDVVDYFFPFLRIHRTSLEVSKMSTKRCWMICLAMTLIVTISLADTIKLKNGSVIKGKVTTYGDREFTVLLDLGSTTKKSGSRMVIAVDDVESILFDSEAPPPVVMQDATDKGRVETPVSAPRNTDPGAPAVAEKSVAVIAAADWTSSEIKVMRGQRVSITATGQIGLGGGRRTGPEGITVNDQDKLVSSSPTGALIAVIGDDNNDFITIGAGGEFTAQRDGVLFLSVNEGNLKDNSGSFSARIKVYPR